MQTHPQNAADAVRNAVELLNEFGPEDWRNEIDVHVLRMEDVYGCVLGQIYGSFYIGMDVLMESNSSLTGQWPSFYGFDTPCDAGINIEFGDLTAAWKAELTQTA